MKLLLYCTKGKLFLRKSIKDKDYYLDNGSEFNIIPKEDYVVNGKIVAECDFEVEEIIGIRVFDSELGKTIFAYSGNISRGKLENRSCLNARHLTDYLQGKSGYAIHIKNLKIFDKPKELIDYHKIKSVGGMLFTESLTNAPQNMMRVSVNHWDYATYNADDIRILISIKPQWLCKILNGDKTIEIRKKVLREMIK